MMAWLRASVGGERVTRPTPAPRGAAGPVLRFLVSAFRFSETRAEDDHLYFFAGLDRGLAGDDGEAVGGDH